MNILKFSIDSKPPTQAELVEQKKQIESSKKPFWYYLPGPTGVLCFAVLVVFLLNYLSDVSLFKTVWRLDFSVLSFSDRVSAVLSAIACFVAGVASALYFLDLWASDASDRNAQLANLDPISPEGTSPVELLEWCNKDKALREYQNAVIAQGRLLVNAEYEAAKEWMKGKEAREAFKALSTPVVPVVVEVNK